VAREGTIAVDAGEVSYRVVGDGPGLPLVCLHGGPGLPHDYISNLAALADERPVVFYDQLGCGSSDRPDDSSLWRAERFVDELQRVRDVLGHERVHLLGQSWGGMLALLYALEQPKGLESLVLASPVVSVPRWIADADRLRAELPPDVEATLRSHEASGFVDCPEYVAATLVFWKRHVCRLEPWPDELERALSGFGVDVYRTMWGPSEFTCTGILDGLDLSARLGEVSLPTLFTCGRFDEATPEANEHYRSLMSDARLLVFEESSHTAHLEQPGDYLAALREFLAHVEASTAS
jgi:proline iminopeptidase